MSYYSLGNVKILVGETTDDNNNKINMYGKQADNIINIALQNIETTIPLATIPTTVSSMADNIAAGLYFFVENGDDVLYNSALKQLEGYIENKYKRPHAVTRGPW